MKLVTWNIGGLNKVYKQMEVRYFITDNNVSILVPIKRKIKKQHASKIMGKVAPERLWLDNYSVKGREYECYGILLMLMLTWSLGLHNIYIQLFVLEL